MANRKTEIPVHCSFCGKEQGQVASIIAGGNGAYICNSCVKLALEVIREEQSDRKSVV